MGGGDWLQQDQHIQSVKPNDIYEQTTAIVQTEHVEKFVDDVEDFTAFEWGILICAIIGFLLALALIARYTPFKKSVGDMFTTLARITKGAK